MSMKNSPDLTMFLWRPWPTQRQCSHRGRRKLGRSSCEMLAWEFSNSKLYILVSYTGWWYIYIYMDDLWWMIHYNNHISWTLPVINGWFIYTGWWYTYPAEKWWSQLGVMNFPTEWKVIKFHGSKPPTRYCIYIYIYIAWDCTKGYDQFWSSPQVGISQKRW